MSTEVQPGIDVNEWHPRATATLGDAYAGGRLAHALLLGGVPGIGKRQLAHALTAMLLCADPARSGVGACGTCKPCRLLGAGTHPDLRVLRVAPDASSIGVDAVRELCARLATTAQLAGNRVGLIEAADALTINAANSLLKTLEEPPPRTYLLLVSDYPARLLATVRSRCQALALGPPPGAVARAWLARALGEERGALWLNVARGAPLLALTLAADEAQGYREKLFAAFSEVLRGKGDPVRAAAAFGRPLAPTLALLDSWVSDLIRLQAGGAATDPANIDLQATLRSLAARLDLAALFGYLDRIRAAAATRAALNGQLVVEDLFVAAARIPQLSRG